MKDDDDDDDDNTLIHWFCLIPPPRVSRSAHIFSPEWKTSLSLSEGIRCFSTMIKKHFMWMLNFDLTPPWKCNCWDVIKPQIFKLYCPNTMFTRELNTACCDEDWFGALGSEMRINVGILNVLWWHAKQIQRHPL